MKILITNDDGIHSEGLKILAKELCALGDVFILAPDRERSATGHAITVHHPLRVEKIKLFNEKIEAWAVNGTPSDCIKLALEAILPQKPDIIFSGINRGPNLGNDVLYSGTVSAAVEGGMFGIPSIAVSLAVNEIELLPDYNDAARFSKKLALKVLENQMPSDIILNINVPPSNIAGIAITKLGTRRYKNTFDKRKDPRGKIYYWLAGEVIEEPLEPDSDVWAIKNNFLSITPIKLNLTNIEFIDILKKWDL